MDFTNYTREDEIVERRICMHVEDVMNTVLS